VTVGPPPQHPVFQRRCAYLTSGYGSTIELVYAATGRVVGRSTTPYGSFELDAADGYVAVASLLRGTLAIFAPTLKPFARRRAGARDARGRDLAAVAGSTPMEWVGVGEPQTACRGPETAGGSLPGSCRFPTAALGGRRGTPACSGGSGSHTRSVPREGPGLGRTPVT
jgi:hypothetical protein